MFEAFAVLMTCSGQSGLSDVSRIVQSNATCDSSPFIRPIVRGCPDVYSSFEPRLKRALWPSRIAVVRAERPLRQPRPRALLRDYTERRCRTSLICELHALSMNPKSKLYQPDHWRGRAEATRKKAEALADGRAKDRLLKIAEEYDKLARRAQMWQMHKNEDDTWPEEEL